MSQLVRRAMTADEFLEWDLEQPDARHELIDGAPVAMTGARQRHDRVVINGLREISGRLVGSGCEPFTADIAVRMPNGNVRRPDLGVHCGPFDDAATYAANPRLVMEVLSPSTRTFDLTLKLEEYRALPGLDYILLVDPEQPAVILWARDAARAWGAIAIAGLDRSIDLPAIGVSLLLADLYRGVTFGPGPRPVADAP